MFMIYLYGYNQWCSSGGWVIGWWFDIMDGFMEVGWCWQPPGCQALGDILHFSASHLRVAHIFPSELDASVQDMANHGSAQHARSICRFRGIPGVSLNHLGGFSMKSTIQLLERPPGNLHGTVLRWIQVTTECEEAAAKEAENMAISYALVPAI